MIEGSCHCGRAGWSFAGTPERVSTCNCGICRRYGALWAYGGLDDTIRLHGLSQEYRRIDEASPSIAFVFCGDCGCVTAWKSLREGPPGVRRAAVNMRLAPPEAIAAVPVRRFDGRGAFAPAPDDGRCVRDYWF